MDSILETVKAHLGLTEDDITFNEQIIDDINSVFMILHQLGIGPSEYFAIEDESETWNDFFGDAKNVNAVKTYMYMKVRLMFDPPTTSFLLTSMQDQCRELECRLSYIVDPGEG